MIFALVVGRRCLRPLHEPELFIFIMCLMRRIDHKNGTPSKGRRPRLVIIYDNKNKGFLGNSILSLKYMRSVKLQSTQPQLDEK